MLPYAFRSLFERLSLGLLKLLAHPVETLPTLVETPPTLVETFLRLVLFPLYYEGFQLYFMYCIINLCRMFIRKG